MRIMSDTERNLQNLQAAIDSLADDLSNYECVPRVLYRKAAICESLARLIRTKEELQGKIQGASSVVLDRVTAYILQKGTVKRKTLIRSGCVRGGSKIIDQALSALDALGYLKTTIGETDTKRDLCYSVHLPEELPEPVSMSGITDHG